MSPGHKAAKTHDFCPHCGEAKSFDGGYCFSCGMSVTSKSRPFPPHVQDYDDLPDRVSFGFLFDRLLFTRLWYVPASLIIFAAFTVTVTKLDGGWLANALVVMLGVAELTLVVWFLRNLRREGLSGRR